MPRESLYAAATSAEHLAVEASLTTSLEEGFGAPEPPTSARPGHVVLSVTTDTGVRAEAHLPASHGLLPDLLARRATRVRDVAPGVILPEPRPHPSTPLSALRDDVEPTYTLILQEDAC